MKTFNKIFFISSIILAATACSKTDYAVIPSDKLMGDSLITSYSIEQLIDSFATNTDEYTYLKYGTKDAGLFTSDPIKSDADVVIGGVVTSSDVEGNIYKYIIVQEQGKNGRAIKISVDASGLSAYYPLGARVWIRCNDLFVGKYAQSYQIGTLYYNPEKYVQKMIITSDTTVVGNVQQITHDTTYTNVYRKEPGRFALPIAKNVIHSYGIPDKSLVVADTMTIAEIRNAGASLVNKLVCIKNAFFTGNGADYNQPVPISAGDMIFAPSTNGIGYPQSREIQDGTGSIFVSTSEYAKFASYKLPASTYRGNITAIVGWYNDKSPADNPDKLVAKIYHQLTLRSISDLGKGFEEYQKSIAK